MLNEMSYIPIYIYKHTNSILYQYTIPCYTILFSWIMLHKTKQIVAKPKLEWETEFMAFRELCARNGLSMSREIYDRAIKTFLRDHHWPPGNSQTVLESFDGSKSSLKLCEWEGCKRKAVWRCRSSYPYGKNRNYCSFHKKRAEYRREICEAKKLWALKKKPPFPHFFCISFRIRTSIAWLLLKNFRASTCLSIHSTHSFGRVMLILVLAMLSTSLFITVHLLLWLMRNIMYSKAYICFVM